MGVSFNSDMPGFDGVLSQQDIEDTRSYIKSLWPERDRTAQAERTLAYG